MFVLLWLFLLHPIEMLFGADKESIVSYCIGSKCPLFEAGVRKFGELRAGRQNGGGPIFGLEVDFAIRSQWRSPMPLGMIIPDANQSASSTWLTLHVELESEGTPVWA